MKKNYVFAACHAIILLVFAIPGFIISQGGVKNGFTYPPKGNTIKDPNCFHVAVDLANFDKNSHYWLAIASVANLKKNWDEIDRLYDKSRDEMSEERKKMNKIISAWKIDKYWPVRYIEKKSKQIELEHDENHPLIKVQPLPKILLIIKVDELRHKSILKWLQGSEAERKSGRSIDLTETMIIDRREVFFDVRDK